MTQAQLAEQIGTTQSVLTNYETDRRKPTVDKIPVIAKALNVSVEALYGISHTQTTKAQPKPPANSREKQMQDVFRELPATQQRVVLQQAEGLLLRNKKS